MDEPRAGKAEITLGEPLDRLSVAELEARIAALHAEILRVQSALEAKRASMDKAASVFRR